MATFPPPPREPHPQVSRRASQEYRSQQESDRASTTSQHHDDDPPCSTPPRSRIWSWIKRRLFWSPARGETQKKKNLQKEGSRKENKARRRITKERRDRKWTSGGSLTPRGTRAANRDDELDVATACRLSLLPPHAAKTLARSGYGPVNGFPPGAAGCSAPPPVLTVSLPSPRLAPGPWGAVERCDEEGESSVVVELDVRESLEPAAEGVDARLASAFRRCGLLECARCGFFYLPGRERGVEASGCQTHVPQASGREN
ncbi:hypothetical protein B0T24DRAFT_592588 [Lasiosphaeria ovina]|uniref:Uncharacterized protein n=1 Tax=Lasiosphaeria ovina TaxID=92902 RepID=A0AAE0NAN1_9PEZI|nr:hypothetical protein B0T24DRAFT_592588 [Lasiosphaeria ovina]